MPEFNFQNPQGATLSGRLESPASPPTAVAIFAHCFSCSKNVHAASRVSRALASLGIAVLRFDFTGLGASEGDFANTNFSSNVGDILAAANALRDRLQAPSLLVGHSLGGAAVLMAASEMPEVKAIATIGAPNEPAHVENVFGEALANIDADGSATIRLAGRDLRIESQFLADLRQNRLAETLPKLRKPLLIFHSPTDQIVPIDHARYLFDHARHPKNFIALDGADHMLDHPQDAEFVASTLAAWASRYLPHADEPAVEPVEDGSVIVTEQNRSLAQIIRTSSHHLPADEPISVGGTNTGPNPYELLLASLGACVSMTLRLYANRKQWPVESIEVRLRHSRIHAEDCATCETKEGRIDRIEKEVIVSGDLDEAQLSRLAEIADRCPVHRTLLAEKQILSKIRRAA